MFKSHRILSQFTLRVYKDCFSYCSCWSIHVAIEVNSNQTLEWYIHRSLLSSVMDIDFVVLKKVSVSLQPKCQSCEDVSETSVAYCFVCKILYCQTCWNYHQRITPTKVHKSIMVEDVSQKTKKSQEEPVASQAKERTEHVLGMTAETAMKQSPAVVTAYNGFQAEGDKLKNVKTEGEKIKESIQ